MSVSSKYKYWFINEIFLNIYALNTLYMKQNFLYSHAKIPGNVSTNSLYFLLKSNMSVQEQKTELNFCFCIGKLKKARRSLN